MDFLAAHYGIGILNLVNLSDLAALHFAGDGHLASLSVYGGI
jgi:hypothetical protein